MGDKYLIFPQAQTKIKRSFCNANLMDGWHNLVDFSNSSYFTNVWYKDGKKCKSFIMFKISCLPYYTFRKLNLLLTFESSHWMSILLLDFMRYLTIHMLLCHQYTLHSYSQHRTWKSKYFMFIILSFWLYNINFLYIILTRKTLKV